MSIITIAGAAYGILRDIAHKNDDNYIKEIIKSAIIPGKEREFWGVVNRPINYLKHADNDSDVLLQDVQIEYLDNIMWFGCAYYQDLGYTPTKEMTVFLAWFMAMHPDRISLPPENKKEWAELNNPWFRSQTRTKQLEFGRRFLAQSK